MKQLKHNIIQHNTLVLLASMVVVVCCFLWANDAGSIDAPVQQQQHHAKEHYQVFASPQQQSVAEEEDLPSFHFSEPVALSTVQAFSSLTLFTVIPLHRVHTAAIPIYVRNHSWKHFLV